jgi:acyl-CoA thioesterase-1
LTPRTPERLSATARWRPGSEPTRHGFVDLGASAAGTRRDTPVRAPLAVRLHHAAAIFPRVICPRLAPLALASAVFFAPIVASSQTAAPDAAPAPAGQPRIVCLGDSLTEGLGVDPEQAWPDLLQRALRRSGFPRAEIVNAGVSGSTSASASQRLRWQLRSKPDIVILALGANDGLRGISPAEMKKNLSAAIDLAQSNGITVLLAGMKMPPNYGGEFTREFESVYTSLAAEKKVPLIPFLLEGVAAEPSLNLPDGIHPNADGYVVMAKLVEKYLRPLLGKYAA